MAEPRWLVAARAQIGQHEIKGTKHNPRILKWFVAIRAPFTDDETPWCAAFVGGMLESVGIKSSRSAAARSYLGWGRPLQTPVPGCIVVFERGPRNGHVAFYIGRRGDSILTLGGNQSDEVNISVYPKARVLGYRWPNGEPFADQVVKPVVAPRPGVLAPVKPEAPTPRPKPVAPPEEESVVPPPPDVEGDDVALPPVIRSFAKTGFLTTIGTVGATLLGSIADWRVASVLVTAGFLIFVTLWFTRKRSRDASV